MHEGLLSTLRAARARLNAAIVAYRAFFWAAPSAIAAGLLVALLRAAGLGTPAFPLWGGLVILGAAAGAAKAWKSRIDVTEAARWLDERLGGEEKLSAALACIGRVSAGLFDGQIIREAELLAPRASSLRASPRPLARRAAIAALACAIGAYAVFVSAPYGNPASKVGEKAPGGGRVAAASAKAADGAFARDGGKTASAFASSFFPDDKRLATLAERAILEGRLDDLRDMLRSADREYGSKIARALGEAERERLTRDRERIREAADALAKGAGSADEAGRQGRKDGGNGGGDEGGGAPNGAGDPGLGRNGRSLSGLRPERKPRIGSRPGRPHGGERREPARFPGFGGLWSDGGWASRRGAGWRSPRGALGRVESRERLRLGCRLGEYPSGSRKGEGSARDDEVRLVLRAAASGAAIRRRLCRGSCRIRARARNRRWPAGDVPLEYEDFVRSYFMALSKGDSR